MAKAFFHVLVKSFSQGEVIFPGVIPYPCCLCHLESGGRNAFWSMAVLARNFYFSWKKCNLFRPRKKKKKLLMCCHKKKKDFARNKKRKNVLKLKNK